MSNKELIAFIRELYGTTQPIPLSEPVLRGNEKAYVIDAIDSGYVSSVGKYVNDFESRIEQYTGAAKAVATVNGSAALHTALYMAGVRAGDLVITQALTFVATCNVLYHIGAEPIFVDVSKVSLGLCPIAAEEYLSEHAKLDVDGNCIHKATKRRIRALMPMHTFGHPVQMDELEAVCLRWNLILVEDAAESLGSLYKGKHTGTIGEFGALSFNGNKIITTGGGGMVLCKNAELGTHAKHITTTAKVPHAYEFYHDEPGFNYRMPNLNAALGFAQIEALPNLLEEKRWLASRYADYFSKTDYQFVSEPDYARSNYWLNSIICPDARSRESLLSETNESAVMTRPVWKLMHRLPMFQNAMRGELLVSEWLEAHLVNLPSTPILSRCTNE